MNKIINLFLAMFFPERCPYCSKVIEFNKIACDNCIKKFPETYSINRVIGGYPCVSPFFYQGIFADAVKRFKFQEYTKSSDKLARVVCDSIRKRYNTDEIDIITYVPMHPKKQKKRGFNQSELLAKDISKELNIPCKNLLIKVKNNNEQHKCASPAKRRDNVRDAYKAVKDETIKGKTILIIDDILTTGYTLGECAKTIEKYTDSTILCATVCAKNNIYT